MVLMRPGQCTVAIVIVGILCLALVPPPETHTATIKKTPPSWTIMVYMADDYPPALPWQENVNQMEAANQAGGTNVVVLVDPLGTDSPMLLHIQHDEDPTTITSPHLNDSGAVIPTNGSFDMGAPQTLRAFINYSAGLYSAERYVLVMWGHAGGWRYGLCPDGTDILSLPEFASALAGATTDIQRKLDMVVIDSCGEASMEMLSEIHPYVDYFVGSEKNIPSAGLPYKPILNRLAANVAQTTGQFSAGIVDDFIDWSRYNSTISAAMAAFNLSRVGALENQLESFSSMGAAYDSLFHDKIHDALNSTYAYTEEWNVDLGDLLGQLLLQALPPELHLSAIQLSRAYADTIVRLGKLDVAWPDDGEYVARASGIVIYAPTAAWPDEGYADLTIASGPWYLFGRLARASGPTNYSSLTPKITMNGAGGSFDSATITWPGAFEQNWVYVFREESSGIVYIGYIETRGNSTTVNSVPFGAGHLMLSASAMMGGIPQAQKTLHVVLSGEVQLIISVTDNGKAPAGNLDVKIEVGNSTFSASAVNGICNVTLAIPAQAQPGDLVRVQVLDRGSGEVIGEASTILAEGSNTVSIQTYALPPRTTPATFNLAVAMLPGILILIFDLQLYVSDKKKRRRAG